ncbi:MAG: hypothetical protein MUC43_13060 [Pirellula sp.]|nr:hypothetical protein [Pirellula sp.]
MKRSSSTEWKDKDLLSLQQSLAGSSLEHCVITLGENPIRNSDSKSALGIVDAIRFLGGEESRVADSVSAAIADTLLLCDAPSAPILAVLGLLNAGKSSLVSTFLNQSNRARVLIGSSNQQGTHRFVLWLPECWRSIALIWDSIQARLNAVFDAPLELLDPDPERSREQYNAIDQRETKRADGTVKKYLAMESPLIGFDSTLDRWGIALMDCPDIQTGLLPTNDMSITRDRLAEFVESVAQKRLELLAKVSPFCSAFVIVLPANAMHDEKVSRLIHLLKERMPGTPQIAAVNRVPRRYRTEEIQAEISKLYGTADLSRVYMAYSFEGPLDRERIPMLPSSWTAASHSNGSDGTSLPLFFRIDQTPACQPPQSVPDEAWLLNIGSQLDKSQLLDGSIDSHLSRIQSDLHEALNFITKKTEELRRRRDVMRQSLAQACLEFSRDPSPPYDLRLQASKQIVAQISQSLERTAPWWATPGRWVARIGEFGKEQVSQVSQWLRFPEWITGKTESLVQYIRGRWTSGDDAKIVTAELFLKALERMDRAGYWELDSDQGVNAKQHRETLLGAIQNGIDRFQKESEISLDTQDLDLYTAKLWSGMPWKRRLITGLAPAAVLFAPLVAVIALPVDFGGSSVLVFASLKELLGAGLAGLGIALLSGDSMPRIAESEAAWQQYGDLVAVLCDELGMDRPSEVEPIDVDFDSKKRRVPISSIPRGGRSSTTHMISQAAANGTQSVHLNQGAIRKIQSLINSLRNPA